MPDESLVGRVRLRPMRLEDVDEVAAIERLCFPLPWPPETYRRDLRSSTVAHYWVCRLGNGPSRLLGYGGYWLVADEAHISTLGVHPDYRCLGVGEYLLAGMLQEALSSGAHSALLEVRLSNAAAQGLYCKYGFRVTGRRRRYYRDNNEDALIMEVGAMQGREYRAFFAERWERLMQRLGVEDGRAQPSPATQPGRGGAADVDQGEARV